MGVAIVVGGFVYLYWKERAKNLALLADNKHLVEETETIKKNHQLDFEKRRYQYEHKHKQYSKYFEQLDEMGKQSVTAINEIFLPMVSKFRADIFKANGNLEKSRAAYSGMSENFQQILKHTNDSLIRFKSETNSIRLIASPEVRALMDKMEILQATMIDFTAKLFKSIASQDSGETEQEKQGVVTEFSSLNSEIQLCFTTLREQIRRELDEI